MSAPISTSKAISILKRIETETHPDFDDIRSVAAVVRQHIEQTSGPAPVTSGGEACAVEPAPSAGTKSADEHTVGAGRPSEGGPSRAASAPLQGSPAPFGVEPFAVSPPQVGTITREWRTFVGDVWLTVGQCEKEANVAIEKINAAFEKRLAAAVKTAIGDAREIDANWTRLAVSLTQQREAAIKERDAVRSALDSAHDEVNRLGADNFALILERDALRAELEALKAKLVQEASTRFADNNAELLERLSDKPKPTTSGEAFARAEESVKGSDEWLVFVAGRYAFGTHERTRERAEEAARDISEAHEAAVERAYEAGGAASRWWRADVLQELAEAESLLALALKVGLEECNHLRESVAWVKGTRGALLEAQRARCEELDGALTLLKRQQDEQDGAVLRLDECLAKALHQLAAVTKERDGVRAKAENLATSIAAVRAGAFHEAARIVAKLNDEYDKRDTSPAAWLLRRAEKEIRALASTPAKEETSMPCSQGFPHIFRDGACTDCGLAEKPADAKPAAREIPKVTVKSVGHSKHPAYAVTLDAHSVWTLDDESDAHLLQLGLVTALQAWAKGGG